MNLTSLPAWQALVRRRTALQGFSLGAAFAEQPQRAAEWRVTAAGLTVDYSRQLADAATRDSLVALAEARELPQWRARLFAGDSVNDSEARAAQHAALRSARAAPGAVSAWRCFTYPRRNSARASDTASPTSRAVTMASDRIFSALTPSPRRTASCP